MGSYEQTLSLPSAPFTVKVVGVRFVETTDESLGYPLNLHALRDITDQIDPIVLEQEGMAVVLVREPDNPHDPNAIAVHVPQDRIGKIGHVPAKMAERLAPELDAGLLWESSIFQVLIDPDHLDRPGISIRLQRVPLPPEEGR